MLLKRNENRFSLVAMEIFVSFQIFIVAPCFLINFILGQSPQEYKAQIFHRLTVFSSDELSKGFFGKKTLTLELFSNFSAEVQSFVLEPSSKT